jgi:hypothetical protein
MDTTHTTVTVRVRLPEAIWRHIKAQAVLAGLPVSDFVAQLLTRHVVDTPFPDPATVAKLATQPSAALPLGDPVPVVDRLPDEVDPRST